MLNKIALLLFVKFIDTCHFWSSSTSCQFYIKSESASILSENIVWCYLHVLLRCDKVNISFDNVYASTSENIDKLNKTCTSNLCLHNLNATVLQFNDTQFNHAHFTHRSSVAKDTQGESKNFCHMFMLRVWSNPISKVTNIFLDKFSEYMTLK